MRVSEVSPPQINDLRDRFERDGYVVIDSTGVPEQTLDAIPPDLDGLYGQPRSEEGIDYAWKRIKQAWKISENVKALALAPKILSLLEDLYGRKPIPFQTLNFRTGSQQAAHSDQLHFNSEPPGYMCGVWVALEDIDMDNGPLVYYPGSQKLPFASMQDAGARPDRTEYKKYERYIADLIEREGLEPSYGTLRKGEVLIWAANILHGGATQQDPSRTRHSQVTHYYFEGCRYWIPMISAPEEVFWRDIERIT
jgi:ectoine hydroxylase-related dioxygenase (phytanoyl-CoA dioxygenase family)